MRHLVLIIAALLSGGDCCFSGGDRGDTTRVTPAFERASALAVDPAGIVYVIDGGRQAVLRFGPEGTSTAETGGFGWSSTALDQPKDVAAPNGIDVYVADYGNHRIQRYDRHMNAVSSLSLRENDVPEQQFGYPLSVDVDRFGALYILDGENVRVVKIGRTSEFERIFGGIDAGKGMLRSPRRLRVSQDDMVYVLDGNRIVAFDLFGNYIREVGEGLFTSLRSITVDNRTLYALDSCRVISFTEKGTRSQQVSATLPLCQQLTDIAIRQESCWLLTEQEMYRYDLKSLLKPDEQDQH